MTTMHQTYNLLKLTGTYIKPIPNSSPFLLFFVVIVTIAIVVHTLIFCAIGTYGITWYPPPPYLNILCYWYIWYYLISSSFSGKLQKAIRSWSCSGMGWVKRSTSSKGMLHATAWAASSTRGITLRRSEITFDKLTVISWLWTWWSVLLYVDSLQGLFNLLLLHAFRKALKMVNHWMTSRHQPFLTDKRWINRASLSSS